MICIEPILAKKTENFIVNRLRNAGCVFAEDEAMLLISAANTLEDLLSMVEQRAEGLPLEYAVGWAEFCGLKIEVDQGVFIPRKRTEFLAHLAASLALPGDIVVDLCCGSGAVGAAIAAAIDGICLYAADIDPLAVRCTARNLSGTGGRVFEGDLYQALPPSLKGQIKLLAANVPYVPSKAIELLPQEARIYEANVALDGGEDGLDLQRRIAEEAPLWLAQDGNILVETSERQASKSLEIFVQAGLSVRLERDTDLDATVVIATK